MTNKWLVTLKSTFLEIIEPNNKIIMCIYKHPNVPVTELKNDHIENFLMRKKIILISDFNINILHCDSDKDTTDLWYNTIYTIDTIDTIYA